MSTLIGYIKQELNDAKLRKALLEVVEDVDALIPQNESEFADVPEDMHLFGKPILNI